MESTASKIHAFDGMQPSLGTNGDRKALLARLNDMPDKKYKLTGEHFYKFFQCPHWIWYDVYGDQTKKGKIPPLIEMIHQDGLKHEKEMIKSRKFEEIKPELFRDLDEAFLATMELMKQGKNIYHGVLMEGDWVGIPILLEARRREVQSRRPLLCRL